jgi:PIN domain nuclease of toxin-antitoxin system
LIAKQRFTTTKTTEAMRSDLLDSDVAEIPLAGTIAIQAVRLPYLPGDPADRFIVASAMTYDATLMTADKSLLRWRHKLKRQDVSK